MYILSCGKVLFLTLKQKWFNQIRCGEKKEEYREKKPYWDVRMKKAPWDMILFSNGYGVHAPSMLVEYKGLEVKEIDMDSRFKIENILKQIWGE